MRNMIPRKISADSVYIWISVKGTTLKPGKYLRENIGLCTLPTRGKLLREHTSEILKTATFITSTQLESSLSLRSYYFSLTSAVCALAVAINSEGMRQKDAEIIIFFRHDERPDRGWSVRGSSRFSAAQPLRRLSIGVFSWTISLYVATSRSLWVIQEL